MSDFITPKPGDVLVVNVEASDMSPLRSMYDFFSENGPLVVVDEVIHPADEKDGFVVLHVRSLSTGKPFIWENDDFRLGLYPSEYTIDHFRTEVRKAIK